MAKGERKEVSFEEKLFKLFLKEVGFDKALIAVTQIKQDVLPFSKEN